MNYVIFFVISKVLTDKSFNTPRQTAHCGQPEVVPMCKPERGINTVTSTPLSLPQVCINFRNN
jgi:hypothetical protein